MSFRRVEGVMRATAAKAREVAAKKEKSTGGICRSGTVATSGSDDGGVKGSSGDGGGSELESSPEEEDACA